MRRIILSVACFFAGVSAFAQSTSGQIAFYPYMDAENLSESAVKVLRDKAESAIVGNGFGTLSKVERFVLKISVNNISGSVAPTNPPRISKQMSVNFIAGDIFENRVFASCNMELNGIGTTDNKAIISAFSRISPSNKELSVMLEKAKCEILAYYGSNADHFISNAKLLSLQGNYDEAIVYLMSIPPIDDACFSKCQDYAMRLYTDKVNVESQEAYNSAKAEWIPNKNVIGASRAAAYLKKVNIAATCYPDALTLWSEISDKLDADEKAEREAAQKQYEDKQAFKLAIVDACKSVGTSFGDHQPQNVTKVVKKWR